MSSASFTPACLLYLTFCSIKSGTKHKTGERMKYHHEFNKDAVLSRPVISPALILVLSSFFVHTPQCSSYLLNTVSLRTTAHLITLSHHLSYLFSDIQPPISSNNTTNLYPSVSHFWYAAASLFTLLSSIFSYLTFLRGFFFQYDSPVLHLDHDHRVVEVFSIWAEVTGVVSPVHLLHPDLHLIPLQSWNIDAWRKNTRHR